MYVLQCGNYMQLFLRVPCMPSERLGKWEVALFLRAGTMAQVFFTLSPSPQVCTLTRRLQSWKNRHSRAVSTCAGVCACTRVLLLFAAVYTPAHALW